MRKIILVVLVAACGNEGYYVANVYQDGSGTLSVEKCAISVNGKPDPTDCYIEPVGAPPPTGH
jgi:hypothetical protein